MDNDSQNSKKYNNENNEINDFFDNDSDKSFVSYGNIDNDSRYTDNNEDSINDKNKNNNNNPHNQIDDYINNNLNSNNQLIINKNSLIPNIINNQNNINLINPSIDINKNKDLNVKYISNSNSERNKNRNNNNNNSQSKSISNINNIIDEASNNNYNSISNSNSINFNNSNNNQNNKVKIDDEMDELLIPNISKNNNNRNDKINNDINKIDNKEKTETKIIDNLSLSSSSNDVEIVSGEDFRKHFQEEKYGNQRRIEVIEKKDQLNSPFSQYDDTIKKIQNVNTNNKFFINNNNNNLKNNNIINELQPKINTLNVQKFEQKNKIIKKRKKFSPLPKDQYRDNRVFHKLLINRLERQILTDICNEYQNKDDFEETYYYIDQIQNLINEKGVEDAMKYLDTIEPMSLRTRVILESTFFFKQIVKEEVEFAKNNDGRLILYKQPDFIFNQNLKYNSPLTGKVNQNHENITRGKSCGEFIDEKSIPNNNNNNCNEMNNKNESGNVIYYSNFNRNPCMYKPQNTQKKDK